MDSDSLRRMQSMLQQLSAEVEAARVFRQQRQPRPASPRTARTPPPPPRSPTDPAAGQASPALGAALRPSLYKHKPEYRPDVLDEAKGTDVLDALRLKSFEGVYNLSFMLLLFSVLYIVVRNVNEKGNLVQLSNLTCRPALRDAGYMVVLVMACWLAALVVFALVSLRVRRVFFTNTRVFILLYCALQAVIIGAPTWLLYQLPIGPLAAAMTLSSVVVLSLKLHSYVATNHLLLCEALQEPAGGPGGIVMARLPSPLPRLSDGDGDNDDDDNDDNTATDGDNSGAPSSKKRSSAAGTRRGGAGSSNSSNSGVRNRRPAGGRPAPLRNPASSAKSSALARLQRTVNLSGFVYFLCVPSLVYEVKFPKLKFIRWQYVLDKVTQLLICVAFQFVIFSQFMLPVLKQPSLPFWLACMKLAMPSFIVWLLGFYSIFHCGLNIAAEITRLADRRFYDKWWNATCVGTFWRTWNMVVYEWTWRHCFTESQHYAQVSKTVATIATFLLSAVFHELLFSVAFKTYRFWFFCGMLIQVPMIAISQQYRGTRRGNIVMWLALFAGQPLLEIAYFREWFAHNECFFCCE